MLNCFENDNDIFAYSLVAYYVNTDVVQAVEILPHQRQAAFDIVNTLAAADLTKEGV